MRYFISFLLLLLLSVKPAYPQWTQSKGLWGASIESMVTTDSSFIIASFGNHIHLFNSNQQGWMEKDAVGFDLFNIGDVLFSQDWYNVYRSFDQGESWQEINAGMSFMRSTPTALFMPGLFRSYDYGDTWENINDNAGLDENDFYYLESWNNYLLVNDVPGIFLMSSDDGETWISLPHDNLPLENYFEVYKFCVRENETWISSNLGVFRLPENSTGWLPVDTNTVLSYGTFYEFHDTLFLGSREGCHYYNPEDSNWVSMNNGLKNQGVYSLTEWKDTLYCSSYPGIFKMGQNGIWELWNSDLSWIRLYSIFAHDSDVWVKTIYDDPYPGPYDYHFFRSFDNGENFIELDSEWVFSAKQTIMTDSLYYLNRQDGFYISGDHGDSWEAYNDGLDTLLIYSIAVSQQYCYAGTPAGLYFTSNPPAVWHRVPNPLGTASVGNLAVNESIIICNAIIDQSSYSMMRSEDGGLTFEPLCIDYECSSNFNNVYHAPNFFSLGWDSSYYSDETGSEWHNIPITSFIGYPSSFSPGENCLLVAGGYYENRIDISYNMGSDWMDISAGLPPAGSQFPIENAVINGQRIFTEVEYKGLWYRDDLVTFAEENEIRGSGEMEVWPNPFTHDFMIKLNLPDIRISKLHLYDLQGRLIYQENELPAAPARIEPPSCIGPGMYVLQVFTGERNYSAKLIKR